MSYSLNVIVCYFIFGSVNVPITDKTPGDFRIWCARKKDFVAANICRSLCVRTSASYFTPQIYADAPSLNKPL